MQGIDRDADAPISGQDILNSLLHSPETAPAEPASASSSTARSQVRGILGKFRGASSSKQPDLGSSRGLELRGRKRPTPVLAESDYEEDDDGDQVIEDVEEAAIATGSAKSFSKRDIDRS